MHFPHHCRKRLMFPVFDSALLHRRASDKRLAPHPHRLFQHVAGWPTGKHVGWPSQGSHSGLGLLSGSLARKPAHSKTCVRSEAPMGQGLMHSRRLMCRLHPDESPLAACQLGAFGQQSTSAIGWLGKANFSIPRSHELDDSNGTTEC